MPERERDAFDSLPPPPSLDERPVTQANLLVIVRQLREAMRWVILTERMLIDVTRDASSTAEKAADKLHDIDGHLFGNDRFGPGVLHELAKSQAMILKLAWTVLGFLLVGLISVIVALMTGHIDLGPAVSVGP